MVSLQGGQSYASTSESFNGIICHTGCIFTADFKIEKTPALCDYTITQVELLLETEFEDEYGMEIDEELHLTIEAKEEILAATSHNIGILISL